MGNSYSSCEGTPLTLNCSETQTSASSSVKEEGFKDPRSPSAEIERTPLRVQAFCDPRSPTNGLPRTPLTVPDAENQPGMAAGKKKLFRGEKAPLLDRNALQ